MSLVPKATQSILQYGYKRAAGLQMAASRSVHIPSGCSNPCPTQRYMDVKCKTALITGGDGGIGLAIADALLTCGLRKAVICSIDCEKGLRALEYLTRRHGGGTAEYWTLDVTNHKQFEDVFKEMIHREGSVDILVNNAGMLKDKIWEKEIDVMVKGVYRGILLANKYMPRQKKKGGCVVNVSSILGFDRGTYIPGYTAAKHAVIGLTKSFGDYSNYKKSGVRQVAVCPGTTITGIFNDGAYNQLNPEWGIKAEEVVRASKKQRPDAVGKGTVYLVEYGPPGSLWVVEDSKLQRVIPPNRKSYLKKVMEL